MLEDIYVEINAAVIDLEQEGLTEEQDAQFKEGELPMAATCYILDGGENRIPGYAKEMWPLPPDPAFAFRPGVPRENLIKAIALLVKEVRRLDMAKDEGDNWKRG